MASGRIALTRRLTSTSRSARWSAAMGHVCPWWGGYFIDNPLRRLLHDPEKILRTYVKPGMTVMDIGCGMGFFSIAMAKIVGERDLVGEDRNVRSKRPAEDVTGCLRPGGKSLEARLCLWPPGGFRRSEQVHDPLGQALLAQHDVQLAAGGDPLPDLQLPPHQRRTCPLAAWPCWPGCAWPPSPPGGRCGWPRPPFWPP
jgi:hypothetical protein